MRTLLKRVVYEALWATDTIDDLVAEAAPLASQQPPR